MAKALLALIVTIFIGLFFIANDNIFPGYAPVVSIGVMGAFIIYFNEKRKNNANRESDDKDKPN